MVATVRVIGFNTIVEWLKMVVMLLTNEILRGKLRVERKFV